MRRAYLASFAMAAAIASSATATQDDALVTAHLEALRSDFDERVVATLDRIDGLDRMLLAARSYLRAGNSIVSRWSWSQAQIDAYEKSGQGEVLRDDIDRVRREFESRHPSYTLYANTQVRSLESQIDSWNRNESVTTASMALLKVVRAAVGARDFPAPATERGRADFAQVLRAFVPSPVPSLAAPGLSSHGQMRAVDFQIQQGTRIVAGASRGEIASAWDAQGWRKNLQAAIEAAGGRFKGPLQHPDEPWHYELIPTTTQKNP